MDGSIVHQGRLDRSALPPPDTFFRDNVSHYRRYGRRARGKCPFHASSSHRGQHFSAPFSMDLDRGLFYCFACNVGGDIISFIQQRDGIDFVTAAKKLGILPPLDRQEAEQWRRKKEARKEKLQAKENAYFAEVKRLLEAMETAEWIRGFALRQRDDELQDSAKRQIIRTGAAFVLLKAEREDVA